MNAEQKAVIALAEKEGLSPCEKDARLVVHDMVNATRKAMQKYEVGYNKMTEKQQDAVLGDLEDAYKDLALTVARTIASGGTPAISMTLKDMKISNGTVTGIVDGSDKHFNDLISKVQDKSEVMVVLFERQYADAMDNIQADKDQRSLPLDSADKPEKKGRASSGTGSATSAGALAKKATELPPKLLEDARAFIRDQQVCTVSGIQNGLKIGAVKATAVLDQMAEEGIVEFVGDSKSGEYKLVRNSAPTGETNESGKVPPADDDLAPAATELTDAIYEQIKAKVLETGKVSIGALSITFNLDDEIVEQAVERLELEGIVTEENEMGLRSIVGAE